MSPALESRPATRTGTSSPDVHQRTPTGDAGLSSRGLTSDEAARRLVEHGANEIPRGRDTPVWLVLARQFNSPVIWLLAGACVIAAALGEVADAIAIATIVVLNGLVGFFQEHRAERAILALRSMTAPRARVLRDGRSAMIAAAEIVPGDALLLEAGDIVAADARLLTANLLSTNEAALTGESVPVEKTVEPAPPDAPLGERLDSVFMGTSVATGTGVAEVVATGMRTELGKIAHLLETAEDTATPLQRRLAGVSRALLYICLVIVGIVALAGVLRGWSPLTVLLSAVSLAVAAVPEGLPAIVTIALAIGVQRMASRNVLIRRLPAVETLGCATVICTDKTGTLTTGVMAARELWGRNHERLLYTAAACSEAELNEDERTGVGDPTEIAILVSAAERGIRRGDIEAANPRVLVRPFDADRKRMSISRADGSLYVKGAVEVLLPFCSMGVEGAAEANADMAARGLRVLAVAIGHGLEEQGLELLGLVGIADPPRTEAIEAVAAARAAGITTVMITGDHPATARAIARELGILRSDVSPDELVHARATPEDKLSIVRTWKARGAVVAMTGDGVNDAPALREAHIGIAMGRSGTEVTREASDMILTDDNFASIIAAVKEGRGIFDNIRKTLVYLLAGNAGELAVMLVAAVVGLPLPLLPLHLLWINIVTDGLPALALVMDPADEDVLKRPPRNPDEPMLGRTQWNYIVLTGLLQAAAVLGVFVWALASRDLTEARNLAFTVLVFGELFRAFAARSMTRTFWEVGAFTNVRLLGVVMASVLVQLGIHHIPATQAFFEIGTLSMMDCALALLVGLCPVTVIEVQKLARRWVRSVHRALAL
jgi:Ca2+-transporting ATPase